MLFYYRVGLGVWALTVPLFFVMLVAFTCAVTLLTSATERVLSRRQPGGDDRACNSGST